MSQPSPIATVDAAAEQAVVRAIIGHHAQLAEGLDKRVEALIDLVDTNHLLKAEAIRQDLVAYARREIIPHAQAEEQALYPPAGATVEGRLLVAGMVEEHHALVALLTELAATTSLVRAAAVARAFAALFAVHLFKENELVVPLLAAAPDVSLAAVLDGMHDLLGAEEAQATSGGCGCGGCGCGGDRPAEDPEAAAPMLSVDTRLDVREVPHAQRHSLVLSTVGALEPGHAVVLVASHAPRPVLAEIDAHFGARIDAQWLQTGPEVWQVRLERTAHV